MNDHDKINEWIDLYNSGKLEEPAYSVFIQLMKTDPGLKVHVNIDKSISKMMEYNDLFEFLEKVQKVRSRPENRKSHFRLLLIAASLLIFLTAGLAIMYMGTERVLQTEFSDVIVRNPASRSFSMSLYYLRNAASEKKVSITSHRKKIQAERLAERFKPLAEYELLVGGVVRSDAFKLHSPNIRVSVPFKSEITFAWETGSDWFPITLEISDNRGKQVMEAVPVTGRTYTLNTRELSTGLFYWKVLSENGLITMGSFILF
jgi:hypothetical protein